MVAVVDSADGREKCTRQCARIAKKSARFHLSPVETGLFIARIVSQNAKKAAVKKPVFFTR